MGPTRSTTTAGSTPERRPLAADGFTLIEMMIVVVVIAVLMAIAVPSFLGARGHADDAAAQSTLNAATKTVAAVGSDTPLAVMTRSTLQTLEPGLTWNAEDAASNGPNEVAWSTNPDPSPTNLVLIVKSSSGKAFYRVTSTVALAGTGGATTSFTFTGSFQTSAGVAATPANALLVARGIAPSATTTTSVTSTTTTVDPKSTTTTLDPKEVDPKEVDPKEVENEVPVCEGKAVYDTRSGKCR